MTAPGRIAPGFCLLTLLLLAGPGSTQVAGVGKSSLPAAPKLLTEADRLHLVLIGHLNDPSIGQYCRRDLEALEQTLRTAFSIRKDKLSVHRLTGDTWNGPSILNYLRKMPVTSKDNVLVYHAGHGALLKESAGKSDQQHLLTLNGNKNIMREDIWKVLDQKQPRGLMVMTDCCSSFQKGVVKRGLAEERAIRPRPNTTTVNNLLLRLNGRVSLTAAEDGKEAGNKRPDLNDTTGASGAFTVAFLQVLSDKQQTYSSWRQAFPVIRTQTDRVSGGLQKARAFDLREKTLLKRELTLDDPLEN